MPRETGTATAAATGLAESEDGEVVLEFVLEVVLLGLELDVELALVFDTFCFLFMPFLGFLRLGSSSDESEVLSSSTTDILGFLLSLWDDRLLFDFFCKQTPG